jgi:hypothetical protein
MADDFLLRNTMTDWGEPTLDELLAEPVVRLVMARDRVDEVLGRELAGKVADQIRETASRMVADHRGERG